MVADSVWERERLDALRSYEILDTPDEGAFDDITLLASRLCETPIALVSLVDENRQWFKSRVGLQATETPRDVAFCAHAVGRTGLMVVEDATLDERFAANPLVTHDPAIRFYAGTPLRTPEGYALGTLCVLDRVARHLTPDQEDTLRVLGRQVEAQLELRKTLRILAQSETRWMRFVESVPVGIFVLDGAGRPFYANQMADRMLGGGISTEVLPAALAQTYQAYTRGTDQLYPAERMPIVRALAGESSVIEDMELRPPGSNIQLEVHGVPIRASDGSVEYALAAFMDVTARRRAETDLESALQREKLSARTDALTGVLNRRAFAESAELQLKHARRDGTPLSVAYMDLDDFKIVNDRFGHEFGDQLLASVAHSLLASLRATDLVARLGGDEFAVLLPNTTAEKAAITMEKVRRSLLAATADAGHPITFSIGVVTFPDPPSLNEMLAKADELMYESKRGGKGRTTQLNTSG